VRAPKRELYDQSSDPDAVKNLAPTATAVTDTIDGQLSTFLHKTSDVQTASAKLDSAQMEKLHALGYMTSEGGIAKSSTSNLIDPKDRIEIANRLGRDLMAMQEDRLDEAIADLRDMAVHGSDVPEVYLELGQALIHRKRYQEAIPFLRTAVEKSPDSSSPYYQLGVAYVNLQQYSDALQAMQAAVARNPNSAQYHLRVAFLENQLLNLPEAEKEYKKTLELDPEYYEAYLEYGRMLLLQGHADAALAQFERAARLRPDAAEPHTAMAEVYTELGQTAQANRERTRAQRLGGASPPEQAP
jgi:tetratricopeptide (TPR) repeat protein